MTYKGKVKDGMVVLEPGALLPDGTNVEVQTIEPRAGALGDRLMKFAGKVTGLPSDMAENHDRYIHERPGP
jgi:hypothetical protein